MTVTLVPRNPAQPFRLNDLQVSLLAGALLTVGATDRDLLAPRAYVPSRVCSAWSDALFAALSDLVLVEVWDADRAQLRPRAVLRAPVGPDNAHRQRPGEAADPWLDVPPQHERTALDQTPFGPLLLSLASWLGLCGGCTVTPGAHVAL